MSPRLRDQVREQLPSAVLLLMDEIEAFAGLEIKFEPYLFPRPQQTFKANAAATMVTHQEAVIYLHDFEQVDLQAVTHELLHIRRYWIDGVPRFDPSRDAQANAAPCANFENCLEHLYIVPQEADYGFDKTMWNGAARFTWQRWPWPEIGDDLGHRNKALLGVLETKLASDADVLALAAGCLSKEGLSAEAERFSRRIDQVLHSKERAASCLARFMKVPSGLLRLVYFDVRGRKWRAAALLDC